MIVPNKTMATLLLVFIDDSFKSYKYYSLEKLETFKGKKKNSSSLVWARSKKRVLTVTFLSVYIISPGYDELNYIYYYQQPGETKNPYFVQYSAVLEDSPVIKSCTVMKTNIAIKNILKPLNIHFNAFLIVVFLVVIDNIINQKLNLIPYIYYSIFLEMRIAMRKNNLLTFHQIKNLPIFSKYQSLFYN
jgi:hypothetical protein